MKNFLYAAAGTLFFCGTGLLGAPSVNLLPGDADVEQEYRSMTGGAYTNSFPNKPRWKYDTAKGYKSKHSIRIFKQGTGVGVKALRLPEGTYTFSFHAKADREGQAGYIAVNAVTDGWPAVLRRRAKNEIKLSTEWKRFSYTFHADGKKLYSPYYGNREAGVNFDRFMLNRGPKALEWVSTSSEMLVLNLPEGTGYVYPFGKKIPLTLSLVCHTKERASGKITLEITDYTGKVILHRQYDPVYDAQGICRKKFMLDLKKSGFFRIRAFRNRGRTQVSGSIVLVRPPEKTLPEIEPCVGLCSAQTQLEGSKLLGVKWLQQYVSWYAMEEVKGRYSFTDMELMKKYKQMGFKLQALVTSGPPEWALSPELNRTIRKMNIHYPRCVAEVAVQEKYYRPLMREFAKRYKGLFDIYELGGELDALLGLNVYYKGKDSKNMVGPFVLGESYEKVCHMMQIAAQEILKTDPKARISSVRPSDVDARYAYIYSREVFKRLGKYMTCFGIDCYPQPRWIGPGQPSTGTEQDLAIRYRDSRNAMKGLVKGKDVMISEYGYFIDHTRIHDPVYMAEHVNRVARSFLKARLIGMKSLHYYTATSTSLEGKRYHMGIWYQNYPLAAAASLSSVGRIVENVTECKEIRLHDRIGIGVFRKSDGRAVGALWSIDDKFTPRLELPNDRFLVTDVMGNPLDLPVKNGKIQLQLSPVPCYIWRTEKGTGNYEKLCTKLSRLHIVEKVPLQIDLRMDSRTRAKALLKNSSLTKEIRGTLRYRNEAGKLCLTPFTVKNNSSATVKLPLQKNNRLFEGTFLFPGYEPYKVQFTVPDLIRVQRIAPAGLEKGLDAWKGVTPLRIAGKDHIHPVDHTTYNGSEDLGAALYLAHDGKYFYFAAAVTDDRHFNKFSVSRLWRGDSLQMGFDPEVNFVRSGNDLDEDDTTLSAALLTGGPTLEVHRGNTRFELQRKSVFKILRNERKKETLYLIKMPLSLIGREMRSGKVFNFNCLFMDDDTDSGADYWLFLRQGLAGSLRPDKWAACILE